MAHGKVYDLTLFLQAGLHAGGQQTLLRSAGQDATYHYDMHTAAGRKFWQRFLIGTVRRERKSIWQRLCSLLAPDHTETKQVATS